MSVDQTTRSADANARIIRVRLPHLWDVGDIALVRRTGELIRVEHTGPVLMVERAVGEACAQALLDGDELVILGSTPEPRAASGLGFGRWPL